MDLRLPVCEVCHSLLSLPSLYRCSHWICSSCSKANTCPIDFQAVRRLNDQEMVNIQRIMEKIRQITKKETDVWLIAQNEYVKNAIKTAYSMSSAPKAPLRPISNPIRPVLNPPVPSNPSPSRLTCPVCLSDSSSDWPSLQSHLQSRHLVSHSFTPPHLPQRGYQSSSINFPSKLPRPDYPTIRRDIFTILEEAQRMQTTDKTEIEAILQGVWIKMLENLRDFKAIPCDLMAIEYTSYGKNRSFMLEIDPISTVFPLFFENYVLLPEEEKNRLFPIAQRMILDKIASSVSLFGFKILSISPLPSPNFTFTSEFSLNLRFFIADWSVLALNELFAAYGKGSNRVCLDVVSSAVQFWTVSRRISTALGPEICMILVIAFLQKVGKLPILEAKVGYSRENYEDFREEIGGNTREEELIFEFFRYYGETFDWTSQYISILPCNSCLKSSKNWQGSSISIEYPLNPSHNLTSSLSSSESYAIIQEFTLTYRLLSEGNSYKSVCVHSR